MKRYAFGSYFAEINTMADLQFMPGEKPYIDRPSADIQPKDLLLYLGCNVLRTAHLARTVVRVLQAMGFEFNTAGGPAHCCGIVHYRNHDPKGASALAVNSMRQFARYGASKVLMWCPSCNQHYDEVVSKQHNIAFAYEHVSAFIARHLDRVAFVRPIERRVAVHYHTGHAQSDLDCQSTRMILRSIPGLELVELASAAMPGRHCNPSWICQLGRTQWHRAIADLLEAAKRARADVLATVYHSCQREICQEESKYPFAIVNYISLLGEAMGIAYPDFYKRYRLRADPDAAFDELQPYVRANRLDPVRVRKVLHDAFAPACEPDASNPS
jgi:heterodisulfide reductase subunit D